VRAKAWRRPSRPAHWDPFPARLAAPLVTEGGAHRRQPNSHTGRRRWATDDSACDLGKWIYGDETTVYRQEAEYVELKTAHALFHLEAAKVIWRVNHGGETSEEILVGSRSAYAIASDDVVSHILRMRKRFPDQEA